MKRAQLFGIGIAGVAGLAAFVGMQSIMNSSPGSIIVKETVDSTRVLVAKTAIQLGSRATAANFRWQEWPKAAVTPQFITHAGLPNAMREFDGTVARASILAGEPVTASKLIAHGKGGVLAAILPTGKRAVSTKISEESAAGKLILPNDHVDVILTQTKSNNNGGAEGYVSDTLLRNIRVLAIGAELEAKKDQKDAQGKVAVLELTGPQAEILAHANAVGQITLALRSIADLNSKKTSSLKGQGGVNVLRYGVRQRAFGVN